MLHDTRSLESVYNRLEQKYVVDLLIILTFAIILIIDVILLHRGAKAHWF